MIIRPAAAKDKQVWDDFVSSKPSGSPYHFFAWKTAVEQSYGHMCIYLMAYENKKLQGILPLVRIDSPFRKSILVSLPFCDLGGVISESPAIARELVMYALQIGRTAGAARLELRLPMEDDLLQDVGCPTSVSSHKVRLLRSLPTSSDNLWETFKSKLKSQIRKAEKNNLVFQWGSINRINDFYTVFSRNMRDLGSPVHAVDWFKSLLSAYDSSARLGLVSLGNEVVGGGILIAANNKVCIPWASTLRNYNHLAPNMLLYWNFLKFAADQGYAFFDFGRSTPGESTFKFKKQWGAEPTPLYWYTFFINEPAVVKSDARSSLRSRAEMVWQKLPLPLANFLGPRIRKYISL
jgi:FemAB-related protein (PEP-CTERM system-associated)